MGKDGEIFSVMDISASGLYAERVRMNVIANNIANASTTQGADGKPYRKQSVIFTSQFQKELGDAVKGGEQLGGVKVKEIKTSNEPFSKVYIPGHPDADSEGFVLMSNVDTGAEMVDLVTASRAYDANLAVMRAVKNMVDRTINAFK